jgi:hypothetical protein
MKLRDLIYASLRLIKVTEQGEYASTSEMEAEAVMALQGLVSSWSANQILIPFTVTETFQLQSMKESYTIGKDADFDTSPPERITAMYVRIEGSLDRSISPLSQQDYFNITRKDLASILAPNFCYYQYGYPAGQLFFWPVPATTIPLTMASYKSYEWINVTSLNIDIPLPGPYIDALKYNLALALASEYATEIPASVAALAQQSIQNITKFTQKSVPFTKFDVGISPYSRWRQSWPSGWY